MKDGFIILTFPREEELRARLPNYGKAYPRLTDEMLGLYPDDGGDFVVIVDTNSIDNLDGFNGLTYTDEESPRIHLSDAGPDGRRTPWPLWWTREYNPALEIPMALADELEFYEIMLEGANLPWMDQTEPINWLFHSSPQRWDLVNAFRHAAEQYGYDFNAGGIVFTGQQGRQGK
jgi:hypothetical protein